MTIRRAVDVPHLGRLRVHTLSNHTFVFECLKPSTGTPSDTDIEDGISEYVTINGVNYWFCILAHTKQWFEANRHYAEGIVFTTDGTWGVSASDMSGGQKNHIKSFTKSAQNKLVKRAALFMDDFHHTEFAKRMLRESADKDRQTKIERCRDEIRRLQGLLSAQEVKLGGLLGHNVADLVAMRDALAGNNMLDDGLFDPEGSVD